MLDSVDEKIIRMKYYEGMSAKEIAANLDIPYETVKKRHQRSLKKLRRYMTIGIILAIIAALLTGCVWFILRYFGIVPGYGINKNPDLPTYVLEEEVSVSANDVDITFTYAYWMNNQLTLDAEVTFDEEKFMNGGFDLQNSRYSDQVYDISGMKVTYAENRGESMCIEEHVKYPAGAVVKVAGTYTDATLIPGGEKAQATICGDYTEITLGQIDGYCCIALKKG